MELNKVYNEDCLIGMQRIPDKSIDMILCDLPYGTTQNKWDSVIPFSPLWREYKRVAKKDAAIVLFSQGVFTAKLILSNDQFFKYKIVWKKSKATNFLNAKKQPLRKHEDICVFYKEQPTYSPQLSYAEPYEKGVRKEQPTQSYGSFNYVSAQSEDGARYPTDVIYFKTAESEGKVYHSTQKPVALFEYLIKTYTEEGETILDNCMGSGTTAMACMNTNRNFIGFENDENYFNITQERIANHNMIPKEKISTSTKQQALLF